MPQRDEIRQTRRLLTWLFVGLFGVILLAAYWSYQGYADAQREAVGAHLEAVASLKTQEISSWRAERISDAEAFRSSPGFSSLVQRVLDEGPNGTSAASLTAWFESIREARGYTRISLINPSGSRVMSSPPASATLDVGLRAEVENAVESGRIAVADFHRDTVGADGVHLSVVVPIVDENDPGVVIAVLAMRVDPNEHLYPYIQQWPGTEKTAETLLVRRDGTDALFLNELKYRKGTALNLRIPLSETNVPAVQAALGATGSMEGIDYRGTPVVAATEQVPDSPWSVVARIDASEVYAPIRARLMLTIFLVVGALASGLLGLLLVLRLQAARLYRDQYEAEAERSWLANAIDCSLNEVYVFDAESLAFEYLNRGALANVGYSMTELATMTPVDIKPEYTEESFRELVGTLLDGTRDLLVLETNHRRKDGTTYPVEIHLQLTERGGKRVFLALISDITVRRAAETELEQHRQHLEFLVQERTEELQAANEELAATNEELHSSMEELASINEEFEASNEELQSLYLESSESAKELARLNEELALADSAKSDFLASMSHELRTPLNSIIGFSDIMLQGLAGELNAEQRRQLEMVNNSGKHLLALINDVLDLSKVESGSMVSEAERFDLCAEANAIVESVRPQADALSLKLTCASTHEAIEVVSDSRLVRQVMFNLLSNAIKFTHDGSVEVRVSRAEGGGVDVAVADTGPGIASADLDKIFDRFTQVHVHDDRPEGTGLGLAISWRLAELLGGTLSVESVVGEGSTFTFSLPASAVV